MAKHSDLKQFGKARLNKLSIFKIPFLALSVIYRLCPSLLVILGLCTLIVGLEPTASIWITRYVIDSVSNALQAEGCSVGTSNVYKILTIQFLILSIFLIFSRCLGYISFVMSNKLSLRMRSAILTKMSGFDMYHFDQSEFYDMGNRAMLEAEGKPLLFMNKITGVIAGLITFASMSSLLIVLTPKLIIAIVFMCTPYLLIQFTYSKKIYQINYARTNNSRKSYYLTQCLTDRQYIPEILSFNLWRYLQNKWFNFSHDFFIEDRKLYKNRNIAEGVLKVFHGFGIAIVSGYIVYKGVASNNALTVGQIMMYIGAFAGATAGLGRACQNFSGIYEASLFFRNYLDFSALETNILPQKGIVCENINRIDVCNVSFIYPGSDKKVLNNINASFIRGESTLLVGNNGAGKTTLIKLLLRLYQPSEGNILVNGIDILDYELASLRKNMGVIFQDFIRYAFPAKENIGVGYIDNFENIEKISLAAKKAKIHDALEKLPEGYNTVLTRQFDNGSDLSLGQWQRVCLARLFMKNSPVMIFDEPTASLDIETEAHLLQEVNTLAKDRICILVSHRMFRPGVANRIIVMEDGQITEHGSHEVLASSDGKYSKLCDLYNNLSDYTISKIISLLSKII